MLIAGGGISGLATALALARRGIACTVLEQSDQFTELGAGIQLGPNALRALTALGLRQKIEPLASWPQRIVMRDAGTGKPLHGLTLGTGFQKRFGEQYACLHRGDLLATLLDACRSQDRIRLCTAAKISGISMSQDRVQVSTAQGQCFEDVGLIGADGLWSQVRTTLFESSTPRFSGDVALRALIPNTGQLRDVNLWLGAHLHVVSYPVRAGAFLNLVAICEHAEGRQFRGWSERAPEEVIAKFSGQTPELSRLLGSVAEWSAWALSDRDPLAHWSRGRTVLLGDAAHASLQYLAQGACLALEDAVALAAILAADPAALQDPGQAFETFSQQRQARGAKMIRTARRMGQLYHAAGARRLVRNLGMRLIPESLSRESMAWVYQH